MKTTIVLLVAFAALVLNTGASVVPNNFDKSTPVYREANGLYTVKIEFGTPGQELEVALSHLKDPIIVSKDCGVKCSGRTTYDATRSDTASLVTAAKTLSSGYGNFVGTQDLIEKTKIAGKTLTRAGWHLANSADLPPSTTHVGILPVTGNADSSSLEVFASFTPQKTFAINFARDSENVGTGRLWLGATDPSISQNSVVFLDVLKFQGFSMMRFTEGQFGDTTLSCQLGPKTDCDATLNLASNYSTLGRNIDSIATSLGMTKRDNQYVVDCGSVQSLPNLALKMNDQQLVFKPEHYVVRNQVQGVEECLFGFVSSSYKDFQIGLNLIRHLYVVYRETNDGNVRRQQYGFRNVDFN